MSEETVQHEEEWPPAPRQDVDLTSDTYPTQYLFGIGVYLLGLCVSILYWLATLRLAFLPLDFMFPSLTLVQSIYSADAIRALVGLAVALMLILRKNRFGKPLLIGISITALLFIDFDSSTQSFWQ